MTERYSLCEQILVNAGWVRVPQQWRLLGLITLPSEPKYQPPYSTALYPLQTALRVWARNQAARKILAWAWEFRQRAKVKAGEELEFENVLGI